MTEGAYAEWARDLYQAADDLGYIIVGTGSQSVRLLRRGPGDFEIEISSFLVSGPALRELLRPYERAK